MSKHAVVGLVRSLAPDLAQRGISIMPFVLALWTLKSYPMRKRPKMRNL